MYVLVCMHIVNQSVTFVKMYPLCRERHGCQQSVQCMPETLMTRMGLCESQEHTHICMYAVTHAWNTICLQQKHTFTRAQNTLHACTCTTNLICSGHIGARCICHGLGRWSPHCAWLDHIIFIASLQRACDCVLTLCVRTSACLRFCARVNTRMCMFTYMCTCMCMCKYEKAGSFICLYTHIGVCMYVCIYIYIYEFV